MAEAKVKSAVMDRMHAVFKHTRNLIRAANGRCSLVAHRIEKTLANYARLRNLPAVFSSIGVRESGLREILRAADIKSNLLMINGIDLAALRAENSAVLDLNG